MFVYKALPRVNLLIDIFTHAASEFGFGIRHVSLTQRAGEG